MTMVRIQLFVFLFVNTTLCAFPNRYGTSRCTLAPHPKEACQLTSNHTSATKQGAGEGRVEVTFGEKNCTVRLEGCKQGLCYSFQDASDLLAPTDPETYPLCDDSGCHYVSTGAAPSGVSRGVFASIAAVSGAAEAVSSRHGFAFRASSPSVVLRYTTHTCAAYYARRGRQERQLCDQPLPALTILTTGLAVSLPCSCKGAADGCTAALEKAEPGET
uniref:Uncharacterized protein n=1 Tax=Tetraselmis sp. GSL018 TaxID=582737 RepID=A0A061S0V8_9CHLO|mmetsp:Transcript_35445/g.84009  ORF Transcript_35445/g.84009 Transcript_35445/m.84009 type:complete len:217 (+) Transcript_35445:397-1047(+)